ncbi:MAG: AAA family ATPase [Deltaproteobacteria bacterium]|nr:AAA family ATPase [Deltaproteobacteria bacterium]
MSELPGWAAEMRQLFRAGSTSQFVLYGSVHDLVPVPADEQGNRYVSLRQYLTEVMFDPFDVVIQYDRGRGIRVRKGGEHFYKFLQAFDAYQGTNWAKLPADKAGDSLNLANLLPRDANRALELINRFVRGSQILTRRDEEGRRVSAPLKVAVMVDYAHFIVPRADALQLSGERSQVLIQLLDWASDPAVAGAFVATVLITNNLADLSPALVESPYNAKIKVELPKAEELVSYVADLTAEQERFEELSDLGKEELSAKLVGLSRVNVRSLILRALKNGDRLTHTFVTRLRKELIEKEASGLIEFIESQRNLDSVAGHVEAKAWLRQDAELLRQGIIRAIPMGYLLAGRIGTGKTFLVTCLAGEVGIPVVELKNFRDKWVGATEGNLEKIFNILQALGQVIVFVDEADQATGKRNSGAQDGGLSGRIYGMLAKKMSDTTNRGKILWIFATSRPDLLEVDLKRQGRLDVHIPLFPPQDPASRHDLFYAMARKVGLEIDKKALPELPDDRQLGGNEMEGILVRALRLYETQGLFDAQGRLVSQGTSESQDSAGSEEEPVAKRSLPEVVKEVIDDFRPSAHIDRLEFMDLLAVKECTDERFLPDQFRAMALPEVNRRIAELKMQIGEY